MFKGQKIHREFIPSITSRHCTCGSVSARPEASRELQEAWWEVTLLNMLYGPRNAEATRKPKNVIGALSEQLHWIECVARWALGGCLSFSHTKTHTEWLSKEESFTFNPWYRHDAEDSLHNTAPCWCRIRELGCNQSVTSYKWLCGSQSVSVNTFFFFFLMQSPPPEEQHDELCDYHQPASFPISKSSFPLEMCHHIFRTSGTSFIKPSLFKGEAHGRRAVLALAAWRRRTIRASACVRPRWRPTHMLAKPTHVAPWVRLIPV